MKYLLSSILILLFSLVTIQAQNKVIKPVNIKSKTTIYISGKSREYFALDMVKENLLQVSGPGKLKLITRARFTSEKQQEVDFSVFYRIDGTNKIETKAKKVTKAQNSKYKNPSSGLPGQDFVITLDLTEGEHTIQVWGGNGKIKVDARYIFTPSKQKKTNWVSMTPLVPNEPVNIISGEQIVDYFRFSESKPLKVKITGPTKLKVLTRVENHYNMKGTIFYRLKVNEDGKLKNTFQLNSVRSETAVYQKERKKVPGRAKEIVIEVPSGTHNYEIIPLDKDKATLLGKVFFPKKDIKLGK